MSKLTPPNAKEWIEYFKKDVDQQWDKIMEAIRDLPDIYTPTDKENRMNHQYRFSFAVSEDNPVELSIIDNELDLHYTVNDLSALEVLVEAFKGHYKDYTENLNNVFKTATAHWCQ
jgi:hypothetical protein